MTNWPAVAERYAKAIGKVRAALDQWAGSQSRPLFSHSETRAAAGAGLCPAGGELEAGDVEQQQPPAPERSSKPPQKGSWGTRGFPTASREAAGPRRGLSTISSRYRRRKLSVWLVPKM